MKLNSAIFIATNIFFNIRSVSGKHIADGLKNGRLSDTVRPTDNIHAMREAHAKFFQSANLIYFRCYYFHKCSFNTSGGIQYVMDVNSPIRHRAGLISFIQQVFRDGA